MKIIVEHCWHCGGDGIDPAIKDNTGKVARGEQALRCEWCEGTGHVASVKEEATVWTSS